MYHTHCLICADSTRILLTSILVVSVDMNSTALARLCVRSLYAPHSWAWRTSFSLMTPFSSDWFMDIVYYIYRTLLVLNKGTRENYGVSSAGASGAMDPCEKTLYNITNAKMIPRNIKKLDAY
jgi:hypothetical protein